MISPEQTGPTRPDRTLAAKQPLAGTRILIVDDEPSICALLAEILRDAGAAADYTSNPFEALQRLSKSPCDLVLTDLWMPDMSGFQLLDGIHKQDPTIGIVVVTGAAEISTAVKAMQMGALNYVQKPFESQRVRDAVADAARVTLLRRQDLSLEHERLIKQFDVTNRLQSQLRHSSAQAIEALVAALDSREHETHNHSLRVAEYADSLAAALNLPEARRSVLRSGAMLHDIGKIGVPDEILMKETPLSAHEWELLKKHSQIGHDILQCVDAFIPASGIVLAHHERFDGTGYPQGLRGNQIPLEARIVALADTLDAMTSDRPYRQALSLAKAAEEIGRGSGTQFDPLVVAAFHQIPLANWAQMRGQSVSAAR